MESIKDMQNTGNISNFVDKRTIKTHPFGDNKMVERAYRRAERIVAALYLLTNHITPEEPLRQVVRVKAAALPDLLIDLRDEMRTYGSSKVHTIETSIRTLISLTRVLAVSGYVSFENADIMSEALDELGTFIASSRRSSLAESVRLSREDLLNDVRNGAEDPYNRIKDVDYIKDNNDTARVHEQKDTKVMMRADGIIDVLKSGRELSIRDIAINLPEYSEKMIQRELAVLVSNGRVKKIGSKRWSRYVLSTPSIADTAAV